MNESTIKVFYTLCTETNPLGIRECSRKLNCSKSTVHRAFQILEKWGLAIQPFENGKYELGFMAYGLASLISSRFDFIRIAKPLLKNLSSKTGETIYLGIYNNYKIVLVHKELTKHPIQYILPYSKIDNLYAGATGKSVLAFLPQDEVKCLLINNKLTAFTDKTIIDLETLLKQLNEIHQQGYALTIGERIHGAVGIASPILSSNNNVFGCIVLTMPEVRFNLEDKDCMANEVKQTAESLSMSLGYLKE